MLRQRGSCVNAVAPERCGQAGAVGRRVEEVWPVATRPDATGAVAIPPGRVSVPELNVPNWFVDELIITTRGLAGVTPLIPHINALFT